MTQQGASVPHLTPSIDDLGFAPRPANFDGFVRRSGTQIVDGSGRPLLLRGVGLGNWLLPEGYMWHFGTGAESPREIEALVERLAGPDEAASFWQGFRDRFITERDIVAIAAFGFDHVRLPINSRVVQDSAGRPLEAGYALIDRLIEWCREHRLWVLLDLHGAPGGQTGTNIDDSPNNRPELFMDETYRELTLELWRELARRYRDEPVVLGYDLLNEPLPNEWQHGFAAELGELYRDLTAAIREIDPHHLLMYEGSHWATNWSIFTEVWDENSVLQFHKYWSPTDVASIAPFLEARERLGLPIYMGEGGEHNLEWLFAAFRLFEAHGIGWNLWPWKKIDTLTSPASVVAPDGWADVVSSAAGPAALSRGEAVEVFHALLDAIEVERCALRPEVVRAVTGIRPSVIPAWAYGFDGAGRSYASAGDPRVPNLRLDDTVALRFATDEPHPENPFEHRAGQPFHRDERIVVDLAAGDWVQFDVDASTDAADYCPLDPDLEEAPADLANVAGGIRATARTATTLAWLVAEGAGYPLVALDDHERAHSA
ncbi:cellulase family glycosylhydrolase [Agromyces sp. ISL-38]|uniref:glycoside hydrolase family 5 protein n=1 Tax=Agromyces sp. ISL-38 TaxID=2819107 RepID=UPI001BEC62A0|nr:cellulase family glycosylhydrolase [Agromyces sp. ISL-38]MBT2499214.1 cellulase family glycosylhydrolase [Agromyces sp. ISL-38]